MLPRYSIRTMFYLAVGVALLAIVVGQAVEGETWALGMSWGVATVLVTWPVMLLFYAIVAAYARLAIPRRERVGTKAYYPAPAPTGPPSGPSEMPPSSEAEGTEGVPRC